LGNEIKFRNPDNLNVEMINGGAYGVEVIDGLGNVVGSAQRENPIGGWSSYYFRDGGEFIPPIPNGRFRIRLVNKADGKREALQGTLYMSGRHVWQDLVDVSHALGQLILRRFRRT
jgi:hypothetical protein